MDDKAAKKARDLDRQDRLARDDFVRAALGTAQGRIYFTWLLGLGRPAENPYAGNALSTAFRCGEVNISQHILAHIIATAPEGYFQILRAQHKELINGTDEPGTAADDDANGGIASGPYADPR
jgi:hypothetical protein